MKNTETEILECEDRLQLADSSPLPDTSSILDDLLDDDLIMVGPQGQILNKAYVLENHRPPKKHFFDKINVTNLLVADLGETAVVNCRAEFHQRAEVISLRFTRVWHRKHGQWKVVSGSVTVIA